MATLPTAETTRRELAELMVGRAVSLRVDKAPRAPGAPVLEVDGPRASTTRSASRG